MTYPKISSIPKNAAGKHLKCDFCTAQVGTTMIRTLDVCVTFCKYCETKALIYSVMVVGDRLIRE